MTALRPRQSRQLGCEQPERVRPPQRTEFSLEEMTAAAQAARRRGLPMMVTRTAKNPCGSPFSRDAGPWNTGFFMVRRTWRAWRKRRCSGCRRRSHAGVCGASGANRPAVGRRPPDGRSSLEQLHQARRLDVPVVLGSDSGSRVWSTGRRHRRDEASDGGGFSLPKPSAVLPSMGRSLLAATSDG